MEKRTGLSWIQRLWVVVLIGGLIWMPLQGCNVPTSTGNDESGIQTQVALRLEATELAKRSAADAAALQATKAALEVMATQNALAVQPAPEQPLQPQQPVQPASGPDLAATQNALVVQATTMALQATQSALQAQQNAAENNATAPLPAQPVQPVEPAAVPSGASITSVTDPNFVTWMKGSSILLYEDMAGAENSGTYSSFRFVKRALDNRGIRYTDVGSALGRLKSQMTSGGPGGTGWDLIIISAERKTSVSGEYFDYIMEALNRGSSMILEVWYLDKIQRGKAEAVLARCGLEVYKNFTARNPNEEAMYIVDAENPILHQPNDRLSFSNVTRYWPFTTQFFTLDLGDLMRVTGNGDANILAGLYPTDHTNYGTLFTCMNGQLILQTFSSHQLAYQAMGPIWENYIYNALLNRYQRTH